MLAKILMLIRCWSRKLRKRESASQALIHLLYVYLKYALFLSAKNYKQKAQYQKHAYPFQQDLKELSETNFTEDEDTAVNESELSRAL